MSYSFARISPTDRRGQAELDTLLEREGIRRDRNLDYTVGLYDDDYSLVAAGSLFGNSLRCLAVDSRCRGEGLMAQVVTHLVEHAMVRGMTHLFLYTKADKAVIFGDLGFYEIARTDGQVVFMENKRSGFGDYLGRLRTKRRDGSCTALVMNCNPFTLGHRYLVEQAAAENDWVHLFVVSEDASLFPFGDRYELVRAGCADLGNVVLHETGSYMISSAVFPAYFLPDDTAAIGVQARLDLVLFARIAEVLGVTRRYVGEEPFSRVTGLYNDIMREELPKAGVELVVLPRKEQEGLAISASRVRQLIHDGHLADIKPLVPAATYDYFATDTGRGVAEHIRQSDNVVHH